MSAGIQKVDERGMTLLRAAFEAGYESSGKATAVAVERKAGRLVQQS